MVMCYYILSPITSKSPKRTENNFCIELALPQHQEKRGRGRITPPPCSSNVWRWPPAHPGGSQGLALPRGSCSIPKEVAQGQKKPRQSVKTLGKTRQRTSHVPPDSLSLPACPQQRAKSDLSAAVSLRVLLLKIALLQRMPSLSPMLRHVYNMS